MKKIISSIALASLSLFALSACKNSSNKKLTLSILEMNDIHGHIEEGDGDLAKASYLIDSIRNEDKYDNTILIGNGDMFQETAISRVSYGSVIIEAMNEMKFDAIGLGNHEFDWGLDKILSYFDGNEENVEASFPLINSNLYENGSLVTIENGNVESSTIIEREGIKIGILSYLGKVEDSINKSLWGDYEFKTTDNEITSSVEELGTKLKDNGADVVVVNIHGASSKGVEDYSLNKAIANLKYKGEYLVDAAINGHTHTKQSGAIKRSNGVSMNVIQSSGGLDTFGRIDLEINMQTKKVVGGNCSHLEPSKSNGSNANVNEIITEYYNASKDILEEEYTTTTTKISRYDEYLQTYIANLMMTSCGTTSAICNTGAIRNGIDAGVIDFSDIYALNPFDNHIIITTISGEDFKSFMEKNEDYEFYNTDTGAIDTNRTYTLAIIDYVYYGTYFDDYRKNSMVDSLLNLRDLIIADLRLRKDTGFNLRRDYNSVLIEQMFNIAS